MSLSNTSDRAGSLGSEISILLLELVTLDFLAVSLLDGLVKPEVLGISSSGDNLIVEAASVLNFLVLNVADTTLLVSLGVGGWGWNCHVGFWRIEKRYIVP